MNINNVGSLLHVLGLVTGHPKYANIKREIEKQLDEAEASLNLPPQPRSIPGRNHLGEELRATITDPVPLESVGRKV